MVRAMFVAAMVLVAPAIADGQQRPAPTPGPTADPATTNPTSTTTTPFSATGAQTAPSAGNSSPVPPLSPSGAPPDVVIVPK